MFRLTHLELKIYFADQYKSRSISDKLSEVLRGTDSPIGKTAIEPPFLLRSSKDKQLVSWNPRYCRIVIEKIGNPSDCLERILELLQVIDKTAPLQKLSRKSIVTYWILPTEKHDSFESLEHAYRHHIAIDNPIWSNVFDSSFMCDMAIDDIILHHQSGAMKVDQFNQYSSFKTDKIPSIFLFWLINVDNNTVAEYSTENMRRFVTVAYEHCKNHSELFAKMWEGII